MPTGTSAVSISNVHPYGMEGFAGTGKKLAVVVASDSGHVTDGERWLAFVNHLETGTGRFEPFPVLEGSATEHFLQFVVGDALNRLGIRIHDGIDRLDRAVLGK
jgi:hypothetical protein